MNWGFQIVRHWLKDLGVIRGMRMENCVIGDKKAPEARVWNNFQIFLLIRVKPPMNWGVQIVPEKKALVVEFTVVQLARTTMRMEIKKLSLDQTFNDRGSLNENIVKSINEAAKDWGPKCLCYEIRVIRPPQEVQLAMEMQVEAKIKKQAQNLDAEGEKMSAILKAERKKKLVMFESEAAMIDMVNRAKDAIRARAEATAKGIHMVSEAIKTNGGVEILAKNTENTDWGWRRRSQGSRSRLLVKKILLYGLFPNHLAHRRREIRSRSFRITIKTMRRSKKYHATTVRVF